MCLVYFRSKSESNVFYFLEEKDKKENNIDSNGDFGNGQYNINHKLFLLFHDYIKDVTFHRLPLGFTIAPSTRAYGNIEVWSVDLPLPNNILKPGIILIQNIK